MAWKLAPHSWAYAAFGKGGVEILYKVTLRHKSRTQTQIFTAVDGLHHRYVKSESGKVLYSFLSSDYIIRREQYIMYNDAIYGVETLDYLDLLDKGQSSC